LVYSVASRASLEKLRSVNKMLFNMIGNPPCIPRVLVATMFDAAEQRFGVRVNARVQVRVSGSVKDSVKVRVRKRVRVELWKIYTFRIRVKFRVRSSTWIGANNAIIVRIVLQKGKKMI
jgi:translation initiation factor IF-1